MRALESFHPLFSHSPAYASLAILCPKSQSVPSPPSTQFIISLTAKLSYSGGHRLLKFTVRAPSKQLSRSGGSGEVFGAKMVDSPVESYAITLCNVAKSNGTLEKTLVHLEKIEKVFTEESAFDFFANP
nr:ATP synthase delta chain, chloroplastic [Ipomoea batatas]